VATAIRVGAYGASITPNLHNWARIGVLDNFLDSGEVSGEAMSGRMQASHRLLEKTGRMDTEFERT